LLTASFFTFHILHLWLITATYTNSCNSCNRKNRPRGSVFTVWERLWKYAQNNKNREVGGVLVGELVIDSGASVLEVIGFIEGRYMKENFTTLTFTHETWNDINKRLKQDYPYKKIVGWFHTHPGHGVFLSRYDIFIHRNFFPGKEQVAVVFDPLRNNYGFFVWEEKQIVESLNVFIFAYGNENFGEESMNLLCTAKDNLDNIATKSHIGIDVDLSDTAEEEHAGKQHLKELTQELESQHHSPNAQETPTKTEQSSEHESSLPPAPDHVTLDTYQFNSYSANPRVKLEYSSESSLNQDTVQSKFLALLQQRMNHYKEIDQEINEKSAASKLQLHKPDKT